MSAPTLAAWARYFETVRKDSIADCLPLIADDFRFQDPFNRTVGKDDFLRVMKKMFEDVPDSRFHVIATAMAGPDHGFMLWDFTGTALGRPWPIHGMSALTFTPEGLLASHTDHWDSGAQFWERLPLFGPVMGLVKRRLKI